MIELLEKAIESRDIKSLDNLPPMILSHYLSQLSEDKKSQFEQIKRLANSKCFNPDNPYWDSGYVMNGDRVIHKLKNKIGTAKIENIFSAGNPISYLDIVYDDGSYDTVYPNQIERI